jgi:gas vesicle protein
MKVHKSFGGSAMKGLLAGLGLGIGLGVLLAPKAGSETRKRVKKKIEDVADEVGESVHSVMNAGGNQAGETLQQSNIQVDSGIGDEAAENAVVLEFLNTASKTKLMSISGIGDATARRIIESRQYASHDSVVAEGILSEELMKKLRKTALSKEEEELAA